MISSSLEQYLIYIYKLSEQGQEIKSSDLSSQLNMPLKKTIQALQRMHFQKYIHYISYQPINITDKGKEMAKYLISRDTLIDEFVEMLQLPHSEEEKEGMKQLFSYESLESIERFICFVKQYPEIMNRYRQYNKRKMRYKILETYPTEE